jgi:hypothetical protein
MATGRARGAAFAGTAAAVGLATVTGVIPFVLGGAALVASARLLRVSWWWPTALAVAALLLTPDLSVFHLGEAVDDRMALLTLVLIAIGLFSLASVTRNEDHPKEVPDAGPDPVWNGHRPAR